MMEDEKEKKKWGAWERERVVQPDRGKKKWKREK